MSLTLNVSSNKQTLAPTAHKGFTWCVSYTDCLAYAGPWDLYTQNFKK